MNLIASTKIALKTFITSLSKPESYEIGELFEEIVREIYFPNDVYKLINKTHNYEQNKRDFVENSLNPDYEFSIIDTNFRFYVECKYRDITEKRDQIDIIYNNISNNKELKTKDADLEIDKQTKKYRYIEIFSDAQFRRYKELNLNQKVFIMLGLGDSNDEDLNIFLIPIENLVVNYIDIDAIDYYIYPSNYYVVPGKLLDLIRNKPIGYCSRCKLEINRIITHPLCYNCWDSWYVYKNFRHKEKYCHSCGKEFEATVAKPICINCYKRIKDIMI